MEFWLLIFVMLIGGASWIATFVLLCLPRHRHRSCEYCAYSLVGLPDAVCPECGRRAPPEDKGRLQRVFGVWCAMALTGIVALIVGAALIDRYGGVDPLVLLLVYGVSAFGMMAPVLCMGTSIAHRTQQRLRAYLMIAVGVAQILTTASQGAVMRSATDPQSGVGVVLIPIYVGSLLGVIILAIVAHDRS